MHIYAFGSVCRGEIDKYSDIDLLAITDGEDTGLTTLKYSIYSYPKIQELWKVGNAFAWHLFYESKLLFSSNELDYLKELGQPSIYTDGLSDCNKFFHIFQSASKSLELSNHSQIYDLSIVFLAIRNFSTCYSLSLGNPLFSRNSAKLLNENSLPIDNTAYKIYERARILSTRGEGIVINECEVRKAIAPLNDIENWMIRLIESMTVKNYGQV